MPVSHTTAFQMINTVSVFSLATPEHALGVLRLWGPLQTADIQVRWYLPDEPLDAGQIAVSDLAIVQRDYPRFADQYAQLIDLAATHDTPVVFEIDDLLWELPPEHPDRLTRHYAPALLPMWLAALHADAVTVASPALADYIRSLNPHVWVLPNYLNDRLWSLKEPWVPPTSPVRIGYVGGDSHSPDLQMIAPVLLDILERHAGGVSLHIWGFKPPPELAKHPQVSWELLQPGDYARFATHMHQQAFDIALAPLCPSQFNRSKSAIKFFEYTALGVPCVCSAASPYAAVVEHGATGFLAETLDEWQNTLDLLIGDPGLRLQLARRAQLYVRENWLLSTNAIKWTEAYQEIKERCAVQSNRRSRALQYARLLTQIQETLQQHRQIDALEAELAEIKGSRAWKLAQHLWKWRTSLSAGSRRRNMGSL